MSSIAPPPPQLLASLCNWLSERREQSHSQFMSIEICGICWYCTCIAGSKVIPFAASAIFENIALKTAALASRW